jgi:hypothetical protein
MFTNKDLIEVLKREEIPFTKNGNKGVILDQSNFNNDLLLKKLIQSSSDDELPTLVIKGLQNNQVAIEVTNI